MNDDDVWFARECPGGGYHGYPASARPSINWEHIDGPMLCARDGQIVWLTLWDRLRCWFGYDDAHSLERKKFPEIAHDKPYVRGWRKIEKPDHKPTIEELEAILNGPDDKEVTISPDGTVWSRPRANV